MVKFTQLMKDAAEKTPIFIMATASKDGKPNGVPMGLAKIISDDEIVLVDNFMNKTRRNMDENPLVAVSFWSPKAHGGFQFKGKARVATSGKTYDEVMRWVNSKKLPPDIKPKAIIIVKVDEIYHIGAHRDSGINLAEYEDERVWL